MADHTEYRQKKRRGGFAIGRRDFLKWSGCLSGGVLLGSAGVGRALAAAKGKTLTIGNIGWDEDVALAYLTKVILENELGYQHVTVAKHAVGDLFKGVADGSLDAFQDVWLPRTHRAYWEQYGDKVAKLGPWYTGPANLGLTVPDYVPAKSIADLPAYKEQFGGRIVGIEPGAGEMKIVENKVVPGYHLDDYQLVSSTTPKMLAELDQAVRDQRPIVVTLYKPHWAFSVYRIRYLEDPKGLISGHNEHLYSIVRQNLKHDKPDAYAFLNAIRFTPSQLGQLELAINAARTPEDGVEDWLSGNGAFQSGSRNSVNRQLVRPWVEAAKRARRQA
ncbi:glycine betaine ABC transporter substrate-binding protein [Salinisphaera sp.]|uniref:glycine betaine ABC transporter substrate-binding protein n=1 Tax=Salinisphaera sp. TaxID=1914330 RepID=UPI002D77BFBC|nr:glycine betaine ABC transporter substrate-binding protein [Salinisphaera sp.]HET7315193.1 glycine betaine ABC transporter substrate-binding protein [Salinisphaera sp.]